MNGYEFHPDAEIDLRVIWEYIAEESHDAADLTIARIEATMESLVPFPHRGRRRPDLTERPLRFANAGTYLIAYVPDKRPLWIVAVMHGRRSPRVMAAILRGREQSSLIPGWRQRPVLADVVIGSAPANAAAQETGHPDSER